MPSHTYIIAGVLAALALTSCQNEAPWGTSVEPVYAHSQCGGALTHWRKHGSFVEDGHAGRTDVMVYPSGIKLNRAKVDEATLRRRLTEYAQIVPAPYVRVVFANQTSCETVKKTRQIVDSSSTCAGSSRCIEYSTKEWTEAKHG